MASTFLQMIPLAALLIIAVWTDHRSHRIPNWLTGSILLAGLLSQLVVSGLGGLGTSIAGVLTGFSLFLLPYLMRATAAGDVKLLAAVGAFLGPQAIAVAAAVSLIAGALIGLAMVTYQVRRLAPETEGTVVGNRFPYASAIAIGTWVSVIQQGGTWTL